MRILLLLAMLLAGATAIAEPLRARLTPEAIARVFPGAEEVGNDEGTPPALPVRVGGALVGYIFSTRDTVNATGYAGTPFDLIGGIKLDGTITGAVLIDEHESILGRGVSKGIIDAFVAGFAAATLNDWSAVRPDQVKGATTSARLMKSGMQSAARTVAQNRLTAAPVTEPTLDRNRYEPIAAAALLADGAVVQARATAADIEGRFASLGARPLHRMDAAAPFLEVAAALLTPPSIGVNVVGQQRYNEAMDRQKDGVTIWIASWGRYPYASTLRSALPTGFFYDAVRIMQGEHTFLATPNSTRGLRAADASLFDEQDSALVFLAANAGFDPLQPWQLLILITGTAANGAAVEMPYVIPYRLSDRFILRPPPVPEPPWVEAWRARSVDVAILLALLVAVSAVFVFQDILTRHRRAYELSRLVLLAITLGWLGWIAGGQLSIVNVLAVVQAPFTHTPFTTFLIDPILFVLMAYTGLSLVLLGRGVYCGWLCPFGALQELTNRIARLARVPQLPVSAVVQERLWALKYLAAVLLIGLVFVAVNASDRVAEIEPFKTAISVHFVREWPYVVYAGAVLLAGLFIERFYCRFLCPLGGALAVLGRARLLSWLKRRPQCGTGCRICEADCPIGAIQPSGAIDMNECLQCLDCQVTYHDAGRCPPLMRRQQRRAERQSFGGTGAPLPA